jgi:hypothetical protein
MSGPYHRNLAAGEWFKLSLAEQLANVGSEVGRAKKWRGKNEEYSQIAAEKALELLSLTLDDPKHKGRLKELAWLYEILVDDLYQFGEYGGPDLENYFMAFTLAANERRNV